MHIEAVPSVPPTAQIRPNKKFGFTTIILDYLIIKLPLRTARPQPRLGVFNEGPMLQVSVAGS